jgi:hypothetical protein
MKYARILLCLLRRMEQCIDTEWEELMSSDVSREQLNREFDPPCREEEPVS